MSRSFWTLILIIGMLFIPGILADSMKYPPGQPPVGNYGTQYCKPGEYCNPTGQNFVYNLDNPQELENIIRILEEHGIDTRELRNAVMMHDRKRIEDFILKYQYILIPSPNPGNNNGYQTGPITNPPPVPSTSYYSQTPLIVASSGY